MSAIGGGFKDFWNFHPLGFHDPIGRTRIFFKNGLVQPPTRLVSGCIV